MPSESADQALLSIQSHGAEALAFLEGQDRASFREDRRTFHAVTRCLEIVSEALKLRHPALPWRDIADAGNVYRHDCDNVAADFVFKTATVDLPKLLVAVVAELACNPNQEL